jgi:WXXGXW repeat (2 copies)
MRVMSYCRWMFMALAILFGMAAQSSAQIGISVGFGPPALPVYEQPICPGDGYIWTPGYWAYGDDDYYWVPGTWIIAPQVGFLWTPGYWGWGGSAFFFHEGYWGPRVGFYGGINYGYGYNGRGYEGGRWTSGHFYYNRSVNNVNVTVIHNVYNKNVSVYTNTRVSYNGGNGGINARASSKEEAAARESHIPPVAAQSEHVQAARGNQELRASQNHGKPPIAATSKPGEFNGHEATPAREAGGAYQPPAKGQPNNAARPPAEAIHPKELPSHTITTPPNTGNPKQDQKYQQQQDKLNAKQEQDHQKLQQQQDQQHQKATQQKAPESQNKQMEQQHQKQTQQMEQKHTQQQQSMQQHQQQHAPQPQASHPPAEHKP